MRALLKLAPVGFPILRMQVCLTKFSLGQAIKIQQPELTHLIVFRRSTRGAMAWN